MTQAVGVDAGGALWTEPGGGGSGNSWTHIVDFTLAEDVSELFITQDSEGNTFEYDEMFVMMTFTASSNNTEEKPVELRFICDKSTGKRSSTIELPYAQRKSGTVEHQVYGTIYPYSDSKRFGTYMNMGPGKLGGFISLTYKKLSGIRLWPYTQYIAAGTVIKLYGRNRA